MREKYDQMILLIDSKERQSWCISCVELIPSENTQLEFVAKNSCVHSSKRVYVVSVETIKKIIHRKIYFRPCSIFCLFRVLTAPNFDYEF